MKLSKNYLLKKSKSDEIISFTLTIIDNRNRKTTPRLGESAAPWLGESGNMTILGYSCGLKSSLYTKNHRFTFKALIFCPKTSVEFIESLSIKAIKSDKSSEDINAGESVFMNVAPLYF